VAFGLFPICNHPSAFVHIRPLKNWREALSSIACIRHGSERQSILSEMKMSATLCQSGARRPSVLNPPSMNQHAQRAAENYKCGRRSTQRARCKYTHTAHIRKSLNVTNAGCWKRGGGGGRRRRRRRLRALINI